ncbi:hypothetical protein GOQ29_01470 [Clostridium sp. D2Q-14]|uniref:hypothetical protein n=1 Tax=Anaeromonas gelatinilytica TaxID=2683194 RepID=UPI00193C144B|nr:hypothetical protein [Anaeromonas gelatinilytica]MBS4534281.1 hypothetical protein [Anaeromonas gelatinilytica]
MKIKTLLLIAILSLSLLSSCNKDSEIYIEKNDDEYTESQLEPKIDEEKDDINSLFDTSNLEPVDKKIFLNNKEINFSNTISQNPMVNKSGDILVDFEAAYHALGFNTEIIKSDEDINAKASDENRNIYIAINISKNIKSISINDKDVTDNNTKMYILSNTSDDKIELLVPLDLIAESINGTIIEGEEENSLLLNDSLKFPNSNKTNENNKDNDKGNITQQSNKIFKDIGVKIGDSLQIAINVFGSYNDKGKFQGSDYYVFEDATIFTDIDSDIITEISIFNNNYPIDGIKVGDNIKEIYKRTNEEISPEDSDGLWLISYDNYKGYKAEFTLQDDKKTIRSITIYKK